MNAATATHPITPEDLLAMPDEKDYELVGGELVGRNRSSKSSWIGGRLYKLVSDYCDAHSLGFVWPGDAGFRCFPDDSKKVRKPDVAFVRAELLPDGLTDEGYLRVVPDLAVEVLSPNDLAIDVDVKVAEYFEAGVRLVWVVNPTSRAVRVYRQDGGGSWLTEHDHFDGEDVLPGFSCPVSAIFPPRKAAEKRD